MENNRYLEGKKILYIDTKLFGYYQDIIKAMELVGADVDYIPSGFSNIKETFSAALKLRTEPKNNYYSKTLKKYSFAKYYDFVWVKPAESIPVFFLNELKRRFPGAQFISYHWHPIKRDNIEFLEKIFDKHFSFDRGDIDKSTKIQYLPLFYTDDFNLRRTKKSKLTYDIVFVGNAYLHERNAFLKKIKKYCEANGLRYYFHVYSTYKAYIKSVFNGIKLPKVTFKIMDRKAIADLFMKSQCVIDFVNPLQTGLSMRTLETLGSGTKLITTNERITKEPFYDPSYVYIIDKGNPKIDINFIYNQNYKISDKIERYSIHNWLKTFFTE